MMETKLKNAFDKVEFSKNFEENTTKKICDAITAGKTGHKSTRNGFRLSASYAVRAAIAFGAVILIGTGTYAARKNFFHNVWGSKADIVEPYLNSEKYSRETEHYKFTVENIFLSESSAQYIMHVKAKTEEAKKELDISKLKKSIEDEEFIAYDFTKHSCTGLEFKSNGETSGGSGYIRILTDISENGSWYILDASQKEDTASYSSVNITTWAKWKDSQEQAEFDIPAKNVEKSHSVPVACTQFHIKKCLVNSSGITVEADNADSAGLEAFVENGIKFKVSMKDGSVKTYNGSLIYHNENLVTASCLFNEPVPCEDIINVEIVAR